MTAALYCRLSPRPDGSYEGIDTQEQWGREYAASKWPGEPVEVFADRGISAANGDHRPEYERLRRWVADGRVAHVWCVEQSRLERREVEWFTLAAELDAAGITELHTNRDGLIWVRGEVSGIKAVLAAAEVRKLTMRVNDRLDAIAKEGRPSGATPLGYRHGLDADGGKTLIVVPEQAEGIRWAAEKILSGWSLANVAAGLRDRGLVGSYGGRISAGTVRSVVTSATIAGLRVHRGRVVGKGVWEPILDEPTWRAVKAKLSSKRVVQRADGGSYAIVRPRGGTGRRYLLTGGVATCGVCGHPLVGSMKQVKKSPKGTQPYLLCHPRLGGRSCVGIQNDPTEQYVVDRLLDELDKPEFLDVVAADDSARRRDEITAALDDLDRQREDLAKLWAKKQRTMTEWGAAREALGEQEQVLRAAFDELPAPLVGVDIADVRAAWPTMTLDERREVVRLFVEAVVIHRASGPRRWNPGRVEIVWRRRSQVFD